MLKHLSTGPELPYDINESTMVTSPDGNGVIIVGGRGPTPDNILELKADGHGWVGSWTTLTTKLQYGRKLHVVIPILMEKNICGLSGIVTSSAGGK